MKGLKRRLKPALDSCFSEHHEISAKRFTPLKLPWKEARVLVLRLRSEMSQTKITGLTQLAQCERIDIVFLYYIKMAH